MLRHLGKPLKHLLVIIGVRQGDNLPTYFSQFILMIVLDRPISEPNLRGYTDGIYMTRCVLMLFITFLRKIYLFYDIHCYMQMILLSWLKIQRNSK